MPLRTYTAVPPGGYVYEQCDHSGKVLKRFATTTMPFSLFCKPVFDMRVANNLPRATMPETVADVDEAQCERLGFDPEWVQKKTEPFSGRRNLRRVSSHVAVVASLFSSVKHGLSTLKDWSDEGFVPVPQDKAQARADICTGRLSGNPCAFNQNPPVKLPDAIASLIKGQIEKKNGMKLAVENEEGLDICAICSCFLKLKVWTPLETILGQTTPEILDKFKTQMPACWLNTEKQNIPAP